MQRKKKKNKLMHIRIDDETYQKIQDVGTGTGMTASQFAREAIHDKLQEPDIKQLRTRLSQIENELKNKKDDNTKR